MNIREQMDPLQSFKLEIEEMFQKNFQELALKNNLNKTILSNLMEAARDQQQKIAQMDRNLDSLRTTLNPDVAQLRGEVNRQEEHINDNFNRMMSRLQQVEEGITNSKRNMEQYIRSNAEVNHKLDLLTNKLEKIQRQEGGYDYHGSQQELTVEVQEFQKLLSELQEDNRGLVGQIDFNQKIQLQEPLSTFETKMMLHNKNNEEVLRTKLRDFSEKLRRIQKKVEETSSSMNNQCGKATQDQRRIIEEMNLMEGDMGRLRNQLEDCDQRRRQSMQSSAATLDNLVEQMLTEAKKLEVRVEGLRKGYEEENSRARKESRR